MNIWEKLNCKNINIEVGLIDKPPKLWWKRIHDGPGVDNGSEVVSKGRFNTSFYVKFIKYISCLI